MSEILQPVILVADRQVLCECGKPAVFFTLEGETYDFDYAIWCQECYEKDDEVIDG